MTSTYWVSGVREWSTNDAVEACDRARRDASDLCAQWNGVEIDMGRLGDEIAAHWGSDGTTASAAYVALVDREVRRMRG